MRLGEPCRVHPTHLCGTNSSRGRDASAPGAGAGVARPPSGKSRGGRTSHPRARRPRGCQATWAIVSASSLWSRYSRSHITDTSHLIWEDIQGLTLANSKETMKKKRTNRDVALPHQPGLKMNLYSRVFEQGLKTGFFSPGFFLSVRYPGVKGVANREKRGVLQ